VAPSDRNFQLIGRFPGLYIATPDPACAAGYHPHLAPQLCFARNCYPFRLHSNPRHCVSGSLNAPAWKACETKTSSAG